jgi:hypothetical protein
LIWGLVLLTRLPDLPYHFVNWDEGAMMSQAWAMTRGQALYRDIFQIHPVLGIVIFYPFFFLLSPEAAVHAIKGMNLLLTGAAGILVYRIASSWLRNGTLSLLSASLFVFYIGRKWALSSYGGFYALLPILLSAYLLFCRRDPSRRTYVLCGVLWAIAFFLLQTTAFDIAAMAVCLFPFRWRSVRAALTSGFWLLLGFSMVLAVLSFLFVWQGTFDEAARSMLGSHVSGYARLGPGKAGVSDAIRTRWALLDFCSRKMLSVFAPLLCGIAFGMGRILLKWKERFRSVADSRSREDDARARLLFSACLVWLGANLLGVLALGRFYDHYLIPFVPPLALACVFWMSGMDPTSTRTVAGSSLALLILAAALHFATAAREDGLHPFKVRRSRSIAEYIRNHTRQDDRIFLYRFSGTDVFYLSQRPSTNGIYEYVDMCEEHIQDLELASAKRQELVEHPPAAIVLDPSVAVAPCEASKEFFTKLIDENYVRGNVILGSEIYLRKDRAEGLRTPEGTSGPSAPGP